MFLQVWAIMVCLGPLSSDSCLLVILDCNEEKHWQQGRVLRNIPNKGEFYKWKNDYGTSTMGSRRSTPTVDSYLIMSATVKDKAATITRNWLFCHFMQLIVTGQSMCYHDNGSGHCWWVCSTKPYKFTVNQISPLSKDVVQVSPPLPEKNLEAKGMPSSHLCTQAIPSRRHFE